MSKARIIGAGNAGSLGYGANVNLNTAGGTKKQGSPASLGYRPQEIDRVIKTKATGDKRDFIFSMNQIGGIGRGISPYNPSADGIHKQEPYKYVPPSYYWVSPDIPSPIYPDLSNNPINPGPGINPGGGGGIGPGGGNGLPI